MLTYTVAADTDGTVIDNRIPEETCGLIPSIVLSEIGDALVADDFRYLCIGVHTCQMVLASDKGLKKCLMGESACQFQIFFVACDYDYEWTKVLMERVGSRMNGLSLHYYTVNGWTGSKGSATRFDKDDYYWTMGKCREIEDVIRRHCAIMDEYDKDKNVALMLDEWGTWWDEEPGTVRGHLYQQNTMRDAFVASLSLDIFHKYTDRLKMANIAQVVNVLQSMILTKGKEMVLTPTYYVFKMYKVHQDATYLPIEISCQQMNVRDKRTLPLISATASKNKDGKIHISLSNVDVDNEQEVIVNLPGIQARKQAGL